MPRAIQIFMVFVAAIAFLSVGTFLHLTQGIAVPNIDIVTSSTQQETTAAQEAVFNIGQAAITAEYTISDDLTKMTETIVGTTDQVDGEIIVNLTDSFQFYMGELQIDTPIFATRNDQSEDAIVHLIWQTENDHNPIILFQAKTISGLSGSIAVGDSIQFQVTGDLTIAGMTQNAIFTVTANLQTADRLTGHAEAIISRGGFQPDYAHRIRHGPDE